MLRRTEIKKEEEASNFSVKHFYLSFGLNVTFSVTILISLHLTKNMRNGIRCECKGQCSGHITSITAFLWLNNYLCAAITTGLYIKKS